jgi:hypothetical protein
MSEVSGGWEDEEDGWHEPKHTKAEYDRHRGDTADLNPDELVEDAIDYFIKPWTPPPSKAPADHDDE